MGVCIMAIWGQWRARVQDPQSFPVQRRWPRVESRKDPEVQAAARQRVEHLESALQALGETDSTMAQGLNSALKEARRAAQGRPLAVQVTECQGFIQRSQNRLRQMEERVAEQKALDGALARLSRLREEMAKNPDVPPNVMRQPVQNAQVSGERLRVRVEDVPLMPTSVPADLAHWMDDCQAQLQAALSQGDDVAMLQFSAKLTQGAESMLQMKRVMEVSEDELAVRSAPGEGRFAPY